MYTLVPGVWACSRCTSADPDFIRRRRKHIKTAQSVVGQARSRGGKRRRQRKSDLKSEAVVSNEQPADEDSTDRAPGQPEAKKNNKNGIDATEVQPNAVVAENAAATNDRHDSCRNQTGGTADENDDKAAPAV